MGYIYKITNLVNNKIYIGQTRFDTKVRLHQHFYEAKKGNLQFPLYRAIRKYGEDNFQLDIIEEVEDNILNERERYWIKYYDSYIKNNKGYNCTYGGEGNITIDRTEVYELWDKGFSIQEIANKLSHDRSAIRKILQEYENYNKEESNLRGDKAQAKNRFQSINQYDLNGNFLNSYYNMHEAERQTGISSKSIYLGVHLQQKVVGGFQWRFSNDKENLVTDLSKEKIIKYKQKVKQIDIETNDIINIYESAAEAYKKTGINSTSIRRVCQDKQKTAGGYKWAYC